jgi:hypothetical protein
MHRGLARASPLAFLCAVCAANATACLEGLGGLTGGDAGGLAESDGALLEAGLDEEAAAKDGGSATDVGGGAHDTGMTSGDGAGEGPAGGTIANFTLIDAAVTGIVDGSVVQGFNPIAQGAKIDLALVGSALSIRANTVPTVVGSVVFVLDATYTRLEENVPYFLCADDGEGDIDPCVGVLTVGKHMLTATAYSAEDAGGSAGPPAVLLFTIVDSSGAQQ